MTILRSALPFLATLLAPAAALACPAARAANACAPCGGSGNTSAYLLAVGVGLLAGAGSVAVEGALKKRG